MAPVIITPTTSTPDYFEGSPDYKWHLEHQGHPLLVGYKDVIQSWKAEEFHPDALMQKYRSTGARYFVALTAHHDNFDSFDSSANPSTFGEGPSAIPCRVSERTDGSAHGQGHPLHREGERTLCC